MAYNIAMSALIQNQLWFQALLQLEESLGTKKRFAKDRALAEKNTF